MIIGIPKEIKNNENRVALTPAGARELVKRGHKVYVQATAGVNSGFADDAYTAVGAEMLPSIEEVYARAEMIVKVKEPVAPEYKLIRRDQLVFPFFDQCDHISIQRILFFIQFCNHFFFLFCHALTDIKIFVKPHVRCHLDL